MGALKLYSIGHVAKQAGVKDAVIAQWERENLLPTVGEDRRRFPIESVAKAIALAKGGAKRGNGAAGEFRAPVLAPGALAAAERQADGADEDDESPAWMEVDMDRFIPHDGRKRISARYYADAFRALTAAGATEIEAINRIAMAYRRAPSAITESLRGIGAVATVRGPDRGPASGRYAQPEEEREHHATLEDQLDMVKDVKRIWEMLSEPMRQLVRDHVINAAGTLRTPRRI